MPDRTLELDPAPPALKKRNTLKTDTMTRCGGYLTLAVVLSLFLQYYLLGEEGVAYLLYPFCIYLAAVLIYPFAIGKTLSSQISKRLKREQYESARLSVRTVRRNCLLSGLVLTAAFLLSSYVVSDSLFLTQNGYLSVIAAAVSLLLLCPQGVSCGILAGCGKVRQVFTGFIIQIVCLLVAGPVLVRMLYAYGVKADALTHTSFAAFTYGALGQMLACLLGSLCSLIYWSICSSRAWKRALQEEEMSVRAQDPDGKVRLRVFCVIWSVLYFPVTLLFSAVSYYQNTGDAVRETTIAAFGSFVLSSVCIPYFIGILISLIFIRSVYRLSAMIEHNDLASAKSLFRHLRFFIGFYGLLSALLYGVLCDTVLKLFFGGGTAERILCARLSAPMILFVPFVIFDAIFFLRLHKESVLYINLAVALFLLGVGIFGFVFGLQLGLRGVAYAFLISLTVATFMFLMELSVMIDVPLSFRRDVWKKMVAAVITGGIVYGINLGLLNVIGEVLTILVCVFFGSLLYLFLLALLKAVRVSDLYHLPLGDRVVGVLRALRVVQ